MRLGVFLRLHVVIDLHRYHAGFVGDVAAHHQHHAKLAHRVRKAHHGGGQITRLGQWQHDAEKCVKWRSPQRGGNFQRPLADGFKRILEGLHHKRQRIENRAHHQTRKGEWQRSQPQRLGEPPHRSVRPHRDQQIKANHGGRQHNWQGHERTHSRFQR